LKFCNHQTEIPLKFTIVQSILIYSSLKVKNQCGNFALINLFIYFETLYKILSAEGFVLKFCSKPG
ncbi:hypothetical protein T4B_7594, partial [Trichinella pseudospiralis]